MGRTTHARLLVEHRIASAFLCPSPSWTKTYAIFFLEFSEMAAKGTLLPPLEGSDPAILMLSSMGNRRHRHHHLLLGVGRIIDTSILHHYFVS
jgi:hypothetical protein